MKTVFQLLVVLLVLVAGLFGPGREISAYGLWWLTTSQPPELDLTDPPAAVRGVVEIPLEARPVGRVDLLSLEVDRREVPLQEGLRVDTTSLPDGEHLLTIRAQDRSLRRNSASASLRFSSDNTPPTFEVQTSPDTVRQGHTVVLYVHPSEPADLIASLGGTPLRLYSAGADYWAVLGVDPDEKPGARDIVVDGRDRVGNPGHSQSELVVEPYRFTQDTIQLPAAMTPLLAPNVRASEDEQLTAIYRRDDGPPLWKGAFLRPVLGPISTEFGEVRAYNGQLFQGHHNGTDFQAGAGTPVQAPARGRVAYHEEVRLRGRVLILDHGGGVYTTYAHLSEWLVEPGQEVQAGQPIAKVGTTGLSTGPHLHWELWINSKPVDPVEWTQREVP